MRINFKNLDEPWSNIAAVSKRDVIRTVTDSLIRQKVQLEDLTALFFLRPEPNSNTYLLILGQLTNEKIFEIGICLRIRSDFVETVGKEPLMLLQQLSANFGITQRIGDKESKFFLRETIETSIGAKSFEIKTLLIPPNTDVATLQYYKYQKEIGLAVCALAIALDINKYKAWLNKETEITISPKNYDIFISYKRNTAKDLALNLKKCLTQEGYSTFLDLTDIPKEFEGNQKWSKVRDEAIKNSKRFVLLITIKMETSQEVPKELTLARAVPNMKFIYLRHNTLNPHVVLKTSYGEVIDLSEGNQEEFSNEDDLVRKVLHILQESTK